MLLNNIGKLIRTTTRKTLKVKQTFNRYFSEHLQAQFTKTTLKDAQQLDKNFLRVSWAAGGHEFCDYPHVFLRDNCQCAQCLDASSKNRMLNTTKEVDIDIQPKSIELNLRNNEINVVWPDGHQSTYCGEWLLDRQFPKTTDDIRPTYLYGLERKLWPDDLKAHLPFVEYDALMSNSKELIRHFENLITFGISIVRNAPLEKGVLLGTLSKRMALGYTKPTHYGNLFHVESKPDPSNIAYTAAYLPMHTDLPYHVYQPCIQCLHCIEQSAGEGAGANELADGLKAAHILRQNEPEHFWKLANTLWKFGNEGSDLFGEYRLAYERPIIDVDFNGEIGNIHYAQHVRGSYINAPPEDVLAAYKAYYAYTKILYGNDVMIQYKMEPGDILVFDNQRITHGRTAYDPTKTTRLLEGCYFDWDPVLAKYRIHRHPLGTQSDI